MVSAPSFGLSAFSARETVGDVFAATEAWREVAVGNGIGASECARFAGACDGLREDAERIVDQ